MIKNIIFFIIFFFSSSFKFYEEDKKTNNILYLQNHSGLYFLTLNINDKYGLFLIDTGATTSLIDINQKKKYEFKIISSSEDITGIGGTIKKYTISRYKIDYNNIPIDVLFYGGDLHPVVMAFQRSNIRITGILGADFLKANNAVLDYRNNYLILLNK